MFYISFNRLTLSIIYPICIVISLIYMLYTKITLGYEYNMMITSAIILLTKELSLLFTIYIILFIIKYPYSKLRERNRKREMNNVLSQFKLNLDKETEIIILREKEIARQQSLEESQKKYEKIIFNMKEFNEKQINNLKQEIKNLTNAESYKLYQKANEENIKQREQLIRKHQEKIEIAVKYALIDLDFLKFDGQEIMFISNTIKTFADTRIIPSSKEFKSPIINRFKIKSNKYKIIITTNELGHFSSNLANYLNIDLKETTKLCAYIFNCEEEADNICKSAKKSKEEDRIKLIENIEDYIKSKEKP